MLRTGAARLTNLLLVVIAAGEIPPVPDTPKKPVTDIYHGIKVTDDYRWLEYAGDPAVRAWTLAQNRCTREYLDSIPSLPRIRKRVEELITATSPDHIDLQFRRGKLFALKSQPPKNQPFLVTLASVDDPGSARVIVDPNQINPKGTTAIDFYVPSLDGRLLAVSLSEGGSEDGTVHVYDTATGKELGDVLPRVNYPTAGGSVAWNSAGTGFYYTRYPREGERPKEDLNFFQQVYFHTLGTPMSADSYSLGKDFPRIAETMLETRDDGRYLLATVANGDGGEYSHYLLGPSGKWTQITSFADQVTSVAFGPENSLFLLSLKNAPRGRVLRVPVTDPRLSQARTVVDQSENAIAGFRLGSSSFSAAFVPTATRLYVIDIVGGPSQIRCFDHDGKRAGIVPLPPISSVSAVVPLAGDAILFRSQGFITPPAWYRFDPATGAVTRTALFKTSPADFSDTEVVRESAVSKDGTKIPLNIICRKGTQLNGQNPTVLYGYGGFGIGLTPYFQVNRRINLRVWLEQGGDLRRRQLAGRQRIRRGLAPGPAT